MRERNPTVEKYKRLFKKFGFFKVEIMPKLANA